MNAVMQAVYEPTNTTIHSLRPLPASGRVGTRLDDAAKTLWIQLGLDPNGHPPHFSWELIGELQQVVDTLHGTAGRWPTTAPPAPVNYVVMRSDHPDYFSVGGDLAHFLSCIRAQDSKGLRDYSTACLELLLGWARLSEQDTTTIALVQGRALGGGFETALCADYLIAEAHSTFSFPEITFGLFPCTGAMSLLSRRIGARQAERLMVDKAIYSAEQLLQMGVVDEICERGQGELAAERFIANHKTRRRARLAVQHSRIRQAPFDVSEMSLVVEEWVDTALSLSDSELRSLEMLVMLQRGRQATPDSASR